MKESDKPLIFFGFIGIGVCFFAVALTFLGEDFEPFKNQELLMTGLITAIWGWSIMLNIRVKELEKKLKMGG